ncbi:DUF6297 family protein [Actinophytocola sp.]|uniref:DUF6297 family protein n=1 Tax=Actinophytocola sp. TaxID=1872138 RepID=UPI002ED9A78B
MKALATRWLSGDERTLGLLLAGGVLTMAFFRLDNLRADLGVAPGPAFPLVLLLVAGALAWRSLLSRGFVWLEPAVLTWRDFGGVDREQLVARRLVAGWVGRQLALGYLLALLAAVAAVPRAWTLAGVAVLFAGGALTLGVARQDRRAGETAVVTTLAAAAVIVRPNPATLLVLAAAAALLAVPLLAGSGPPARPHIATRAGRLRLVDGWRGRVLRTTGVQFLDLAMLLPAARPVGPRPLRRPTGLRLAWLGVLGRARHVPTAALLAFTAVATHLALPALPAEVVFALLGYLAMVPLAAGLGELWRSPGRRRWVGRTDAALRADHLVVLTALAAGWAAAVLGLAALAGHGWPATVLLTVPLMSACAIRTVTRNPPTYDNLAQVDTPVGAMPMRLILQTLRGPDVGVLAVVLVPALPTLAGVAVVAAVVALCVLR